ncbi:hypothetical protein Tco_0027516, partial [Tanacetum coccineum]
ATDRPPIIEKGNYIPWESRFRRFLENKEEDGEKMWYSITKGPYVRPMIPDPDDPRNQIPEPLSKMTKANRKRYTADAKEGESLDSVYERLSTLVNVMDRNDVRPINDVEYDSLYDILLYFEPRVQASKAKRSAKNNDPLVLIAHSSQSHASPSHSHSPQPYYVTHPSSVVDSEEDYQMGVTKGCS